MKELDSVVIRFSGDSGDGMQLTGNRFSDASALMGNDVATFPDYPSEIRAPQGTVAGVSGFQVNIGSKEISTPGDEPDVLVAMNAAALKANLRWVRKGGTLIVNIDVFDDASIKKAGYSKNPLESGELDDYKVLKVPVSSQTIAALEGLDLTTKIKERCKNFYALGLTFFIFGRDSESTERWINEKFEKKNPVLAKANIAAMKAGMHYAESTGVQISTYNIKSATIKSGKYRHVSGNVSTAWGLMQAAESAGLPLFLGSYPITPATEILQELARFKNHGVKTCQMEDEIAGICSAIGAAYTGALACTTTSGPGLALKGEAMGLAVMLELPLVIVNVQRGGPSTGLPTKTEQSDLFQALYGRNGESPLVVVAATRPNDCFHMAYEASRLALEYMTPVVLLTDGYIGNGAEPWLIPNVEKEYPALKHTQKNLKKSANGKFLPYERDPKTLARPWAIPGTPGFEHRVGGLEKQDKTGSVSHDPENHQVMSDIRNEKIARVADSIPLQTLEGDSKGDLLVVSWGGTYGATHMAVEEARRQGKKVSLCHLKYIHPMPKNIGDILKGFKKVLVPELNLGQMKDLLNMKFQCNAIGYNQIKGLPFKISDLLDVINKELETL